MNNSKTIVSKLGINGQGSPPVFISDLGLNWSNGTFKYLGIWSNDDNNVREYKNFNHKLEKIKNILI